MKLNYLILPSILLTSFLSIYGMEKSIEKSETAFLLEKTKDMPFPKSDQDLIDCIENKENNAALNFWALTLQKEKGFTPLKYYESGKWRRNWDNFYDKKNNHLYYITKPELRRSPKENNTDSYLNIFDLTNGSSKAILFNQDWDDDGTGIKFDLENKRFFLGGHNRVKIFDIISGSCLQQFTTKIDAYNKLEWVTHIEYDPVNNHLFLGDSNGFITMWDAKTGSFKHVLMNHKNSLSSLIYNNNRNLLFSAHDNTIKIWNTKTGYCLKTLLGHTGNISCLCYDNTHNFLFSWSSSDKCIKAWDLTTDTCIQTIPEVYKLFTFAYDSFNNQFFTSEEYSKHINIWDLESGSLVQKLTIEKEASPSSIRGLWHDAIRKKLISFSSHNAVTIWDLENIRKELLAMVTKVTHISLLKALYQHCNKTFDLSNNKLLYDTFKELPFPFQVLIRKNCALDFPHKPLLYDTIQKGGMLPQDLYGELLKFLTNDKKHPALDFWLLKYQEKLESVDPTIKKELCKTVERVNTLISGYEGKIEDLSSNELYYNAFSALPSMQAIIAEQLPIISAHKKRVAQLQSESEEATHVERTTENCIIF